MPYPTYREVCSGETGHAEVVLVVYDHTVISFEQLLQTFWESHDPTQGMRQGNDIGTQYRSVIHCTTSEQYAAASASREVYQQQLNTAGYTAITTEILHPAPPFYYAENEAPTISCKTSQRLLRTGRDWSDLRDSLAGLSGDIESSISAGSGTCGQPVLELQWWSEKSQPSLLLVCRIF